MAKERVSQRMKDQIIHLHQSGYSNRAIMRALHVGRRTVCSALGLVQSPSTIAENEKRKNGGLYWADAIPWETLKDEINKRGVSVKRLHEEYCPEVCYTTFWRVVWEKCLRERTATIRLEHNIGERTQIDFTDGIVITDPKSGAETKTHLFTGVLPFSSFLYAEFSFDQKLPTFLSLQENMWRYFGGVTKYVVVDNLKSGVTRADIYDPDVNQTYVDFANHWGFAVLPARPYKPRDKGKNESHNNVLQRTFFHEVRDKKFYSLAQLNQSLWEFLKRLNAGVMKDYGVSRNDRFSEERKHLLSLPHDRFEMSEWRKAKVHPDCHIQLLKNIYSVPFQYVSQEVRVRVSQKLVEIFNDNGEGIAVHARIHGVYGERTLKEHYPPHKIATASFEIKHAKCAAQKIGPNSIAFVERLTGGEHPLKNLRRIQGFIRLKESQGYRNEALEYAAAQALTRCKYKLQYLKECANYFQRCGPTPQLISSAAPQRSEEEIYLKNEIVNNNQQGVRT